MFVILVCAGSGSRMQAEPGAANKVLAPFADGRSSLEFACAAFAATGHVEAFFVTARAGEEREIHAAATRASDGSEVIVVPGGATRQESVFNALRAIHELHPQASHEIVMIHDGARPFITPKQINAVRSAVTEQSGAILSVRVTHTLKEVGEDRKISRTVSRSALWEAQTPQAFPFDVALSAHEKARAEGFVGTDDSELAERAQVSMKIVEGSALNMKITTADDLIRARATYASMVKPS